MAYPLDRNTTRKCALLISLICLSFTMCEGGGLYDSSEKKVKIAPQGTEKSDSLYQRQSCGPVALKMVFDYYGIDCTLEEITRRVGLIKKGSSMQALKDIAEEKGLNTEGWKFSFNDLRFASFPSIAYVNGNHFVVVDSISQDGSVHARDFRGRIMFPEFRFLKMWHGETLIFRK